LFIGLLPTEVISAAGAGENSNPALFDFIASQHDRRFDEVPHEVLAFYYTWYGRPEQHGHWVHWGGEDAKAHDIPQSRHYPARGAYDSQDPALLDAHIRLAKAHGLTGFIATWWGQGTYDDQAFRLLLSKAETNHFKVTIYWETAPKKDPEQIDGAVDDLVYVLKNYGSQNSFLKVGGKPVIFVYGRVMGQVPLSSWPVIITAVRARAGDFLLVADGYTEAFARVFDGVHTYNICGEVRGKSPQQLRDWSAAAYASAVKLARRQGRLSCLTVIPGYDDTKIRKPGLNAARQDGQTYRVLWQEAIRARPDWVLITSFNEWHEGSEIEPSWEDGDKYLRLTGEYAPSFLVEKPVRVEPVPLSSVRARLRGLQALLKGRKIGFLPESGDVAFWVSDAELPVKELSWQDVVDPAILNSRNFPIILQSGGERYSSKAKVAGDVVPALRRYLEGGGFLVSIPNQPFPFHYDSDNDSPRVVANQLGLPVQQSFENLPGETRLAFHFNRGNYRASPRRRRSRRVETCAGGQPAARRSEARIITSHWPG
jgi:hypothetical protein